MMKIHFAIGFYNFDKFKKPHSKMLNDKTSYINLTITN